MQCQQKAKTKPLSLTDYRTTTLLRRETEHQTHLYIPSVLTPFEQHTHFAMRPVLLGQD